MFKQQNVQMVFNNLQDKLAEYEKRFKQEEKHMENLCPWIKRNKQRLNCWSTD